MMQNESNRRQNSFRRLMKEKGYYIILSLCVLAVGISGYVFVSTAIKQNQSLAEETLSVPITVTEQKDSERDDPEAETAVSAVTDADAETAIEETVSRVVIRPVNGAVVQDHAMDRLTYNPTTKDWRVHNGIDLAATAGQTVLAAKAGTVSAVYEDDYYGGTVVIRHEDGYSTQYSNLSTLSTVSAGDTVKAGDIIGTVGGTALLELAQEPHLHFEVTCNGAPVDPAEFLP